MDTHDKMPKFDALAYAQRLQAAGVETAQAAAHAEAMRDSRADPATKAILAQQLRSDMRADLHRALWIQGAGLVAVMAGLKIFG